MLGTLMLVLFLCLFATVPIALSLGISTLGVIATQFPSMAAIVASMFFAAISGSGPATAAASCFRL